MKKLFISLLTFLWLSISFSSASWLPTYQQFTYNLCNFNQWTYLSQIINSDYSQIQGNAWYNPVCYHIAYYDQAGLYRFGIQWDYYAEYRGKYWYFDFWNCAGSLSDLMNNFDIYLQNWDNYMCSQMYNWDLPMYVWFYYPYNSEDCSSVQSSLSSCQSSLSSCQSSLATATWNYAYCQSWLNLCQSNLAISDNALLLCQDSLQNQSCPSTWEILSGYILQSEVTSNYCEVEFWLIDPENCPASGGTGDVNWSSFFVNNYQVQGARNIYLFMPDFLNWDYTYVDSWNTLNIEVENQGDEDYIQSVIDINSYRPTSEDFTGVFVSGLTLVMPYIVIVLFIIFVRKLIKKIFR